MRKLIRIGEAVKHYLADLLTRRVSTQYKRQAQYTLTKLFLAWAQLPRYLTELTPTKLNEWRSTWRSLEPATIRSRQAQLAAFFAFCARRGWLQNNPALHLNRIKVPVHHPEYFTRREFNRLLEAASADTAPGADRLRALLLLLRWSGLRLVEAVTLERACLEGNALCLRQLKAGERIVLLPAEIAEILRGLTPTPGGNTRYFFWSGSGTREQAAQKWTRRLARLFKTADLLNAGGSPKRCRPSMLRNTFALELLRAGAPIDQLSRLLGHRSVRTTGLG